MFLMFWLGGNPADWFDLFAASANRLKIVWGLTMGEYLKEYHLEIHHRKSPGQQYREHVSSGGYRP